MVLGYVTSEIVDDVLRFFLIKFDDTSCKAFIDE